MFDAWVIRRIKPKGSIPDAFFLTIIIIKPINEIKQVTRKPGMCLAHRSERQITLNQLCIYVGPEGGHAEADDGAAEGHRHGQVHISYDPQIHNKKYTH